MDGILDLTGSVSQGFPTYSIYIVVKSGFCMQVHLYGVLVRSTSCMQVGSYVLKLSVLHSFRMQVCVLIIKSIFYFAYTLTRVSLRQVVI